MALARDGLGKRKHRDINDRIESMDQGVDAVEGTLDGRMLSGWSSPEHPGSCVGTALPRVLMRWRKRPRTKSTPEGRKQVSTVGSSNLGEEGHLQIQPTTVQATKSGTTKRKARESFHDRHIVATKRRKRIRVRNFKGPIELGKK